MYNSTVYILTLFIKLLYYSNVIKFAKRSMIMIYELHNVGFVETFPLFHEMISSTRRHDYVYS